MKYDYTTRPLSAHMQVLDLIPENSTVLEIGPYTGYLTEQMHKKGCEVTAIEIDKTVAKKARKWCRKLIIGDVEDPDVLKLLGYEQFDVILLADVLEHLKDPWNTLTLLRHYLKREGIVITSLPNIANWSMRLRLLCGMFNYGNGGLLDKTHLRFFTKKSAMEMFADAGYVIKKFGITCPVPFTDSAAMQKMAHSIGLARKPLLAYQFIVVAEGET